MEQTMEQTMVLAPRWALLVDSAAAQSAIERVSKLNLPRRICRPLDRVREQIENAELRQFDAAIEAAVEDEAASEAAVEDEAPSGQDWVEIEPAPSAASMD